MHESIESAFRSLPIHPSMHKALMLAKQVGKDRDDQVDLVFPT
jgi:hypothetical protein